jgi:hypothetical protein
MSGALKQEKVSTAQEQTHIVVDGNVLFSLDAIPPWLIVAADKETQLITCSVNRENNKKL